MDLTASIAPKSDQLNSDDLITGPRTFTIAGADEGSAEQPANIHLAELPGRPWRPSKSMRRVLVYCWGHDTEPYAGRRVTLYRDPEVTFGRDKVGGIKISHLSHIDRAKSVSLTVTRGKRAPHTVDPLPDAPPALTPPSPEMVAATDDLDVLAGWARDFHHLAPLVQAVTARADELKAGA
jgi:hypothetical protein